MSRSMHVAYPCPADVETTFSALSGQGWAHRRAEVLRDGSRVVSHTQRPDGGVELVVSRELPEGTPGFLQRFLPSDGRVVQTDSWGPPEPGGGRAGTWRADLAGAPASLGGTMRLEPLERLEPGGAGGGEGCSYVIDGEVSVRVPLIGGKAESFLADMLERLTAREAEVLRGMV